MSIIWCNDEGWILCHFSFIYDLYVSVNTIQLCTNCGKYKIFHISEQFLRKDQKKRKEKATSADNFTTHQDNEALQVHKNFLKFLHEAKQFKKLFENNCSLANINNDLAVKAAKNVLLKTEYTKNFHRFSGANKNSHSIIAEFENEKYFIPPNCTFYCCDVFDIQEKFMDLSFHRFDVIVMDPPWRNKHVRRKNSLAPKEGYDVLHELDLVKLPIDDLLSADGLIVVWCTNSKQQIKCLLEIMFPAWKVCYVATWYWVKVTESGDPVCPFSDHFGKKQPFERLIIGCRSNRSKKYKTPDSNKLIVSIPSAIHSHKPPLSNILLDYIPINATRLELFARYLTPGWISCGNEVLKLQHHSLFE